MVDKEWEDWRNVFRLMPKMVSVVDTNGVRHTFGSVGSTAVFGAIDVQEGDRLTLNNGDIVTYTKPFDEHSIWVEDANYDQFVVSNTLIKQVDKAFKNLRNPEVPKCDCGKDKSNSLGPHSDYCTLVERGLV